MKSKKGNLEVPPVVDTPEVDKTEAIETKKETEKLEKKHEEFVIREKPAALNTDALVQKARTNEIASMVMDLDAYTDAWQQYATDRNIFLSKDIQAMRKARVEVIQLAGEATKLGTLNHGPAIDELKEKLDEIAGKLSTNIEEAAEDNSERIRTLAGSTHTEKNEALKNAVNDTVATLEENSQQDTKEKPSAEQVELLRSVRKEQREEKATAFAEKYGIADARKALHDAEKLYAAAVRERHYSVFAFGDRASKKAESDYNQARLTWREALAGAATSASPQDKITARFMGIRDTAVRAEELRQGALMEALNEKNKGVASKLLGWTKKSALTTLGFINKRSGSLGDKFAGAHEKISKNKENFDREKAAQNYARAVRVFGGAVIATVATGGFAAMGLPLVLRIARGAVSTFGGTAVGMKAGKVFAETVGAKRQKELIESLRNVNGTEVLDEDALLAEERLYARGNADSREKSRRKVEMRTTLVVAGSSSLLTGFAASHSPFAKLPATEQAAAQINSSNAGHGNVGVGQGAGQTTTTDTVTSKVGTTEGAANTTQTGGPVENTTGAGTSNGTETVSNAVSEGQEINMAVGATIHHPGEGTSALFEELKSSVRSNGLFEEGSQTPGLKHFLETNPNDLSREVGKAFGNIGMRTHIGDQFFVDEHQNIWYEPMGGKAQIFIENDSTPDGFTVHALNGEPTHSPVTHSTESTHVAKVTPIEASPKISVHTNPITSESLVPEPHEVNTHTEFTETADHSASDSSSESYTETSDQSPVQAPEQAPEVPVSAAVESVLVTKSGLTINLNEPSAYTFTDKLGREVNTFFGGTSDERLAAVQEFQEKYPKALIRTTLESRDPLTGLINLKTEYQWDSSHPGPSTLDGDSDVPKIDPNQFTKKSDFVYKKS